LHGDSIDDDMRRPQLVMLQQESTGLGIFERFCPDFPVSSVDSLACLAAAWEMPILGVFLLGAILLAVLIVHRKREAGKETPYVIPFTPATRRPVTPRQPFPTDLETGRDFDDAGMRSGHLAPGPAAPPAPGPPHGVATDLRPAPRSDGAPASPARRAAGGVPGAGFPSESTSEVELPENGTLQLLPGRLEITQGPGAGQDIRFVRVPGKKQEITVGRTEGPPHRHIQLDSPAVSRTHATLVFEKGNWVLRNNSSTNPTVHNGRTLESMAEESPLRDGDLIEVGDVRLVFRMPDRRDRLAYRSSSYTDRGRRSVNQDAVMVRTLADGQELAVVCDGMGSHSSGGVASHMALDAMVEAISRGATLIEAVEEANARVYQAAVEDPEHEGMGTTLVAALRQGDALQVVNVGDSRAYRVDESGIHQLTRDHSFVAEMVTRGQMTRTEAESSPWKNAITRSLGVDPTVEPDLFEAGGESDTFYLILCSDGIHGVLSPDEIETITRSTDDVQDLARNLGERALVRGGEDNVAAAVLAIGDVSSLRVTPA
jgi:PPM family protein phosphatase